MNSFPTIVLIGFGGLCRPLKRPENALEIFNMVLTRLGDDDEKMKYQVWELIGYTNGDIHDYEAAFHAHQIAWIGRRNLLGPKHRKTANSQLPFIGWGLRAINKAIILKQRNASVKPHQQQKFSEAEGHFRQAASMRAATLGKKDKSAARSLFWLGYSILSQAKYTEAESHFRRAAAINTAVLGDDRETAVSLTALGEALYLQKKYTKAEEQFRRSQLIIEQKSLGGNDTYILTNPLLLGLSLCLQRKFKDVEDILQSGFKVPLEQTFGVSFEAAVWLARVLFYQGKHTEAEKILAALFPRSSGNCCGSDRDYTQTVILFWGRCLNAQAKYSEAESVMRQVILDECNKSRSRRSSVDDGFEGLRMVDEYEDDVSDRVNSELSEEDQEDEITEEDIAEPGTENEAGAVNEMEDFGFDEAWEYCHVSEIFAEYLATGQHLEREGKQVEAESVFSLLALLEWNII
ncbi:kinesin light chain [Trichoderma harzianum]|uniref:Kinesin light chain n=1 Tax=Trichoderma harzianum TaxID=5544 RepID=A0A0G0ADL0_TRIHA|nr:kinesin light chain [Trichoderma harzianum]